MAIFGGLNCNCDACQAQRRQLLAYAHAVWTEGILAGWQEWCEGLARTLQSEGEQQAWWTGDRLEQLARLEYALDLGD